MATTIQISDNVREVLCRMKMVEKESYNDVLERMIEDDLELSEQTRKELFAAAARAKAGHTITQADVEKRFGL